MEITRNYSRFGRDLEAGRLPRPDFSHASEKWLRGNADRIYASYTGSKPISARAFSSCSSNCSFLSPLSSLPFSLSLTFFPPLNSASFERLDNENRSRVSVLKRVLNECLEGKVNAIAPRGTHGKLSFPFRRISKNCSSNEEERNRKVLSSAYFLRGNGEISNGRFQKFQIGAELYRKKERETKNFEDNREKEGGANKSLSRETRL